MNRAMTPHQRSRTVARLGARAEDVEEAQPDRLQAVGGGERLQVELPGQLGRRVGRQGLDRIGLGLHLRGRQAVGAGAGGVDHAADASFSGGVEDAQRAGGTDAVGFVGPLDAALHRRQSRQVVDDTDALDRPSHRGRVGDIAHDQFRSGNERGQVALQAGAEVVQHPNRLSGGDQGLDQV